MILVQIGTNNGNDHVLQLCKQVRFDKILLVEPMSIHNSSIYRNYSGVSNYTLDNIAIVPTPRPFVDIYYTENDGPSNHPNKSYEVASIKPEHLIKHNYTYTSLRTIRVPALTINEYLANSNIVKLDYLFLDIEGIDFEVLESIDFGRFDIKHLQIEHLHLDKQRLLQFMSSMGYTPQKGMDMYGYDTLFVKQ